MVMSPPFTALGLIISFRLDGLHLFSLGLRVLCKGSPTVVNKLATRLVQHKKSRLALGTSFGASYRWLASLCVLVRTGRYWYSTHENPY
jgi:hypothetical protein